MTQEQLSPEDIILLRQLSKAINRSAYHGGIGPESGRYLGLLDRIAERFGGVDLETVPYERPAEATEYVRHPIDQAILASGKTRDHEVNNGTELHAYPNKDGSIQKVVINHHQGCRGYCVCGCAPKCGCEPIIIRDTVYPHKAFSEDDARRLKGALLAGQTMGALRGVVVGELFSVIDSALGVKVSVEREDPTLVSSMFEAYCRVRKMNSGDWPEIGETKQAAWNAAAIAAREYLSNKPYHPAWARELRIHYDVTGQTDAGFQDLLNKAMSLAPGMHTFNIFPKK